MRWSSAGRFEFPSFNHEIARCTVRNLKLNRQTVLIPKRRPDATMLGHVQIALGLSRRDPRRNQRRLAAIAIMGIQAPGTRLILGDLGRSANRWQYNGRRSRVPQLRARP